MRYRTLGRTGLEVSELGFGAFGIGGAQAGWGGTDDAESFRALREAISLGVNFLDTAIAYGDGHSESLVGEAARTAAETVYVATKIPAKNGGFPARPGLPVAEWFPRDWVIETTERSLRNLGLDCIDVQQFHTWTDDWVDQGDWTDAIASLKHAGKIRFFGISIHNHEPENALRMVESGLIDTVQVIYNIFDQSPEGELFPAVLAHDVGVIARVPFDEGGLTGRVRPDTEFPDGDFRSVYFKDDRRQEVWRRVEGFTRDLGVSTDDAANVALRFSLGHRAVSTVIAGTRSTENVRRNVEAAAQGPLTDAQIEALRPYRWVRDFYTDFYSA